MVSPTPSRVTRSSSRQPERAESSRGTTPVRSGSLKKTTSNGSVKKSTSNASSATPKRTASNKKKSVEREESRSRSPSPAPLRRRASTSTKKKSTSTGYQTTEDGTGHVADELFAPRRRSSRSRSSARLSAQRGESTTTDASPATSPVRAVSRSTSSTSTTSTTSSASDDDDDVAVEVSSSRPPAVALLPHMLVYFALTTFANFLVVADFARSSTRMELVRHVNKVWSMPHLSGYLDLADQRDLAFWCVCPVYIFTGLLLRWGTSLVLGRSRSSAVFASHLARILSAGVFTGTFAAMYELGVGGSYETLNALFVCAFAFLLQEFVLNVQSFSNPRRLFSLVALAVTGYLGYTGFQLEKHTLLPTAPPALSVALGYALFVATLSSVFTSLAYVWRSLRCEFLATLASAFASVVNFGAVPILAVALYARAPQLFADAKAPASFLEASAASTVMCTLVFLIVVDQYQQQPPAAKQLKA